MNNDELNRFRKNYYKKLEESINEKDSITIDDFNNIIKKVLIQTKIENESSNKIMVYVGSYAVNKNQLSTKEVLTYDENINAKYKKYIDIETQEVYRVDISNVKEFEKEYITVKLPVSMYNFQEYLKNYNDFRETFFKKLIYNSQEEIVDRVKKDTLK